MANFSMRYMRMMERVWLVVTVVLLVIITYMGATKGFDLWKDMYVLPAISAFAYLMRRFLRRRLEKNAAKHGE